MELRSCSHLHFIQSLKGGLLVKTPNVTRGRPLLTFKKVKDIYETLDAKNGVLFPTVPPKDEFRGLLSNSDRVMRESTSQCTVGNVTIKTEPEASGFDCSDGRNSDVGGFGNMTLKQIKETCKRKKRKRHAVQADHGRNKLNTDEEDYELTEPLSNWKFKLSKNAKAKKKSKRRKNCVSTESQGFILTIKSEQIQSEPEILQNNQNVPAYDLDIKVEVPEPDGSDFERAICFVGDEDTSLVFDTQVGYCGVVPNELPLIAAECVSRTGLSDFLANESQSCAFNEACYEYMEYTDPTPLQIVSTSCWDIVEADGPEITNYQGLNLPFYESKLGGYITNWVHPDNFIEAISSEKDHNFDMHDNMSSEDEVLCQINNENQVQMSDMAVHDLFQCMEPVIGSDASLSEVDTNDDSPSKPEASASSISDCGLGSGSRLLSVADDSSMAEEKQSQMAACVDAKRNLSPGIFSCDTTNKFETLMSGGHDQYLMQQRSPQRLFPTRKVISPASQEKLCKAMKSVELHDEEHGAYKGKLCFAKQTEGIIGGAEGHDQIRRAKYSIKPQIIRNSKNEKISSHPRGIPKPPNVSTAAPRFSTGCNSVRSCSESAIAFSQRQMHDIECLATKLTNELNTMKEIAEERLESEACPPTSSKYNANEVRVAIKNATRVEASARKLLSMMSRDCSRFCKIMRLAENGSNGSNGYENVVTKERKKITFADEAGEKLCHVKFFENDMTSLSGTDIGDDQKQNLLVK